MRRRQFIAALGGAVAVWPSMLRAQQGDYRARHLGVLMAFVPDDPAGDADVAALRQGLDELGWIDGRTTTIVYRWAEGRSETYAEAAAEFVQLKVDVIVSSGVATPAMKRATSVIPIVFTLDADPVGRGRIRFVGLRDRQLGRRTVK